MSLYAKFEYLYRCEYGVHSYYTPNGFSDCREPAVATVHWADNRNDLMYVCENHAKFIEESELYDDAP